ncbi:septation protein SepH [Gardnerella sp. Marseille-Q2328]|uniref:septation protein SepH n=1 Tax=Gardnerella sp. Marseille-Q2328 TaxID=2759694 RepID=UPI0020251E20|nr:septation protein SepH [Gardnerella sp. Marseille-Q2328]
MLENPPKEASFDHVDANGDLIFICENTPLRVQVDDTLERAIAESQQIIRKNGDEHNETNSHASATPVTATLPISQIQALIRAGVDPSHVAQRYNVSEAQVRRFSAGVETEKQYAIEQFLLVPAPKQSNMRTLADLIERTLAKAHIGMETVTWRATRRGLEPWRITATFKTATRTIKAEWTWNMHDNTVTCANPSSRLLLGEDANASEAAKQAAYGGNYRDTVSINFPFTSEELPGNSIRSARIERAVSQWELRNSDKLSEIQQDTPAYEQRNDLQEENSAVETDVKTARTASPLTESKTEKQAANNAEQGDVPSQEAERAKQSALAAQSNAAQQSLAQKVQQAEQADACREKKAKEATSDRTVSTSQISAKNADSVQEAPSNEKSSSEHSKRKSGRAAVPSWDEILFGEG